MHNGPNHLQMERSDWSIQLKRLVMARTIYGELTMITQKDGEPRIEYLARVLHELMNNTIAGEQAIDYDETTCDGMCLANDIAAELGMDDLL